MVKGAGGTIVVTIPILMACTGAEEALVGNMSIGIIGRSTETIREKNR